MPNAMLAIDLLDFDLCLCTIRTRGDAGDQHHFTSRDLFLARIYHEAPDDVFELILSNCGEVDNWVHGRGGLNALRLANERCKRVVESCTTS
jgi:hypothetical protein